MTPTMTPTYTVEHVPLSRLQPNNSNVRKDLGDLAELTDSIKAQGVLQPAVVAPSTTAKTKYVLVTGHRRAAAAKAAGLKALPCVVREDLDTLGKQIEAMLVENGQRVDLTPIEEGDAYQQLLDLPDYDVKALAARLGHAQAFVRNRVKVAGTPPKVRAGVASGQITLEQALVFAEVSEHPDLLSKLEKALGTYNWDWQVRAVRDSGKARRDLAAKTKQLEKQGVTAYPSLGKAIESLDDPDADVAKLVHLADSAADKAYDERAAALGDDESDEGLEDEYGTGKLVPAALTDDGHSTCPGRIVFREGEYLVEGCTQPDLHEALTGTDDDEDADGGATGSATGSAARVESPEDAAARAAREQLHEDLTTAATVRSEHLAVVARAPSDDVVHALAVEMAVETLNGWRGADARTVLRIEIPKGSTTDSEDAVRDAVKGWSTAQLVATTALAAQSAFGGLLTGSDWHPWTADKIRAIAATGYSWSEVERQMLAATPALMQASGLSVAGDGDDE